MGRMKVRLLKKWADHEAGTILDPARSVATMLLTEGFAERVKTTKVETAEAPTGENAATRTRRPKRKRRKRKSKAPAAVDRGLAQAAAGELGAGPNLDSAAVAGE